MLDIAGVVADVDAVVDGEDGAFWEGVDFDAAADEIGGYGGCEEVLDGVAKLACLLNDCQRCCSKSVSIQHTTLQLYLKS